MEEPVPNDQAIASPPVDVDALYRAHVRGVFAFIYSRVGNREAAEDLTSEVFMKALAHLDPTRPEASILAWIYRVAHNAVNDYWRVAQRAPIIALDEARMLRQPRPRVDTTQQEQTAARATALLAQLPENYRTVLTCRLLQGLSVAETAAQMGISETNVKVLQHRALKRAATLREDGAGHER
jgi:RNA polymerase sigma-70 factor (ECF subfamily)